MYATRQDVRLKDAVISAAISEQIVKIPAIIVELYRCQNPNTVTKQLFNSGASISLSDFISLEIQNTS